MLLEDLPDRLTDLRCGLQLSAIEIAPKLLESSLGLLELLEPASLIFLGLCGAPDPQDSKAFLALRGSLRGRPVPLGPPLGAVRVHSQDVLPTSRFAAQCLTEACVLFAVSGQYRDESPVERVDVSEVLFAGELAVGDIDEVVRRQEVPQAVVVPPVEGVVVLVAAPDPVRDGNGAVRCDIQPEDELLEIRAMVLVVPARDLRISAISARVLTAESDRRGVEVDTSRLDPVKLDCAQGKLEETTPAAKLRQLFEGASDAIVVDSTLFIERETERPGINRLEPLPDSIEGVAAQKHVMNEDRDRRAVAGQAVASGMDVLVEDTSDPQLFQEVLDQGVRPESVDLEGLFPLRVAACNPSKRGSLPFHGAGGCARSMSRARAFCKASTAKRHNR